MNAPTSTPACPDCGTSCNDCGERMCATNGPVPMPRCSEHATCSDCAGPVYCWDCKALLSDIAADAAGQANLDASRDGS